MTSSPAPAARAVDVLRDALAGLGAPGSLGRDELLAGISVLGEVQAVLDVVKVGFAGELDGRSGVLGPENPVKAVSDRAPPQRCLTSGGKTATHM